VLRVVGLSRSAMVTSYLFPHEGFKQLVNPGGHVFPPHDTKQRSSPMRFGKEYSTTTIRTFEWQPRTLVYE